MSVTCRSLTGISTAVWIVATLRELLYHTVVVCKHLKMSTHVTVWELWEVLALLPEYILLYHRYVFCNILINIISIRLFPLTLLFIYTP